RRQSLRLHQAFVAQGVGSDIQLVHRRLYLLQARVAVLDPDLHVVAKRSQPLSFVTRSGRGNTVLDQTHRGVAEIAHAAEDAASCVGIEAGGAASGDVRKV